MRFRGENLRKAKGLKKFIIFFFFPKFFFLPWDFNGYKEWINQID
jgi:hypothetical protein